MPVKGSKYGKDLGESKRIDNLSAELAQSSQEANEIKSQMTGGLVDESNNALIVIESDDGLIQDYDVLFPFLAQRNVPATLAVITNSVGKYASMVTWEQLHELVDNYGWSVASHTHNNVRLESTLTDEEVENELKLSKQELEKQGFNSDHFTYVGGVFDNRSMKIARKYYKTSATVNRWPFGNRIPLLSHKLSRSSLYSLTLDDLKTDIDITKRDGGVLIIYTHGNDFASDPLLQTKLSDAIAYGKSLGIEFVTRQEAVERLGNIIETSRSDNDVRTLQLTKTGKIFKDGGEITSLSPQIVSFSKAGTFTGIYNIPSLKKHPKHIELCLNGGGAIPTSIGRATLDNDDGTTKQFCQFTRKVGGTLSSTSYTGIMAVDNTNQTRVKASFNKTANELNLEFDLLGTGFDGSTITCHVLIHY